MKTFHQVLLNTLVANVTTTFLWFALTFWVYLETKSVLATAFIGGGYMLLLSVLGLVFGVLVDRFKKKTIMLVATMITCVAYSLGGWVFSGFDEAIVLDLTGPVFWLFTILILIGAVVENMRNIALSTTVTLLVPDEGHARANGLVGTVQGVAFTVTSVFSGLAIGFLGMGWTLVIAIALTFVSVIHLMTIHIPEEHIEPDPSLGRKIIDIPGSITAIRAVPGLLALLLFACFNNLVGGVYLALMDPYGLTLFSVQVWGIVLGITGLGFIIGGLAVARWGLGRNPLKTLLMVVAAVAVLGMVMAVREWGWLYVVSIFLYLCLMPAAEASEQTIIQRVVPLEKQGRVFGFGQSLESASTPISAFLIGPIAEFGVIPFMQTAEGKAMFGWLLGEGDARGIALMFVLSSLLMLIAVIVAFRSKAYRLLSRHYADAGEPTVRPVP